MTIQPDMEAVREEFSALDALIRRIRILDSVGTSWQATGTDSGYVLDSYRYRMEEPD